jgi:hypothetical protein
MAVCASALRAAMARAQPLGEDTKGFTPVALQFNLRARTPDEIVADGDDVGQARSRRAFEGAFPYGHDPPALAGDRCKAAPLRFGVASQRLAHRPTHGVEPPIFSAPYPLGGRIDVADDRFCPTSVGLLAAIEREYKGVNEKTNEMLWRSSLPAVRERRQFDRGHRLSGYPGKRLNFSFQGERFGGKFSVLDGVPIASRSPAGGAVHPADLRPPNCRRSAGLPAPLRFGVASQRLVHR